MSEKRWALLIGIDSYQHLSEREQLHGCVNDTMVWMDVLTSASCGFGFQRGNITQLTNARATREGILNAFDELAAKAGEHDVVFVHYSGHGSQMTTATPVADGDGLDETIVPSDAREATNPARKDIRDKELNRILRSLTAKTECVTMVFDSCHSASVTRDLLIAPVRGIKPDLGQPSPEEIELAAREPATRGAGPAIAYTVLAGCREEEESHEYPPREQPKHGALTWFLTRALMGPGRRADATYRDVFEAAAAGVTGTYSSQHPQIEGRIDRELFGVVDRRPMRFLPVSRRNGNEVTLGGGAAQTVEVGSRWAVYPAGTREPTPEEKLATLVVTAAGPITATASGEDGVAVPETVTPGARVVREGTRAEDAADALALPVGIADDGSELAGLIGSSTLLVRVQPDDPAVYARIYAVGPRESAPADDPVPELPQLEEATIAVVGPDGHLLVPPRRAAAAGAPARVCADIETYARYKRVVDLENPGSRLDGAVELELLRKQPGGEPVVAEPDWVVAEPDPDLGMVVYEEGDLVGVRLTNRGDRPVYPALLDLSLTYDVAVFPECSGKDVLKAGISRNLVEQANGSGYSLSMEGFPFVEERTGAAHSGVETLKLFVTTQEADYEYLEQEGVTRGGIGLTKGIGLDEDWTTVTRQFLIRREG